MTGNADRPLRVGIVGAGLMGRWHAVAATRAGGAVVAVADLDPDRARPLARRYAASSAASIDEMLSGHTLDVVHVCTDTSSHEAVARAAIAAGAHLLVEKPLAASMAGTEALLALAAHRGVSLCPVHQFVFQDGVRAARAAVPDIGAIVHLQATFCTAGTPGLSSATADRLVGDILPHPLSLAQLFLPAPLPVDGWTVMHPDAGELRACGAAAGATVSMLISTRARPTVCSFDVLGDAGSIHLDLYHGYAVIEGGRVSRSRKVAQPFARTIHTGMAAALNLGRRIVRRQAAYPGLWQLVEAMYRALRRGAPAPIAADDMLAIAGVRDLLVARAGLAVEAAAEYRQAGAA